MNAPALSVRNLGKAFGGFTVTRDVSFDLPIGARHALIGPNGAGKTTLINLVTGRLPPDAGQILLDGADITRLGADRRVKRGMARTFQINTLFPKLSPLEAVTLAVLEHRGMAGHFWRRVAVYRDVVAEAAAILASLRLDGECERPIQTLAYGRQRLVEIALALASKPRVLLLDEPAAGVPREDSAELFAAIAGLPPTVSVLFIEHDMDLVFRFATQIIVLVAGAVCVCGTPDEIANDPLVQEIYLGKKRHG